MTGTIWFQALPPFLGDPSSPNCVPQVCDLLGPPGIKTRAHSALLQLLVLGLCHVSLVATEGHLLGVLQRETFCGLRPTYSQKLKSLWIELSPTREAVSSPLAEGWAVTLQVGTFLWGIPQLTWRTSLLTQLQRLTPKIWSPVLWGGPRMYVCNKSPRPPRSRWPMDWHWRL